MKNLIATIRDMLADPRTYNEMTDEHLKQVLTKNHTIHYEEWDVEDVKNCAETEGICEDLGEEEAKAVLAQLGNIDVNDGINWDSIGFLIKKELGRT